jgi:6-pyruvoyl-tetrahydropterin synthase
MERVRHEDVCYNSVVGINVKRSGIVSWKIVVEQGNLSFSAAHFITLEGYYEPLHGHNYSISAELTGTNLTSDSYVLDFSVVKKLLREFIDTVNHHFLLPLHNPHMSITEQEGEWEIRLTDGARFILPTASVSPLPVDNITAERLAEYFGKKLSAELAARNITNITSLTIGVAETEMQSAYYTINLTQ